MLTAAVRDLHRAYPGAFTTDVRTACPELWVNNPYVTPIDDHDPNASFLDCEYPLVHKSNEARLHFLHGFISFFNESLGLDVKLTDFGGDLHLSSDERNGPSPIEALTAARMPYWVVAAGGKYDFTIKWWESQRYQRVVDHFQGKLAFVQIGEFGHFHPPLNRVLDLRGQTSLRDLVRLVFHADGVLCPVTFLMHLAAALPSREPGVFRSAVVIAGGREPVHWEAYPGHDFLHTIGQLPCCREGGCWRSRTAALNDGDIHDQSLCVDLMDSLPRCMDMIRPEQVIDVIEWKLATGKARALEPDEAERFAAYCRIDEREEFSLAMNRAGGGMHREITFCVLTYGDHVDLCQRAIESIWKHCPRQRYALIVGANAISRRMLDYLQALKKRGMIDHLIVSETNLNKGRMMPRMLALVETELVWWFDDDSYIEASETFEDYLEWVRNSPPSTVQWGQMAWCDHPDGFTRVADIVGWVRKARWFRSLPPPSWEPGGKGEFDFEGRGTGDGRWIFILGGSWIARMPALRALKWPDPRLIRYGEDVLLGEAIRQQGWSMMNTNGQGLAIDAAPRRGVKNNVNRRDATR